MSTAAQRITQLAEELSALLGLTVYPEPGAPGRGDVFAYVEPPTFTYEPNASAFCVGGRPVRLRTSVVVVGVGAVPGQELALVDIAQALTVAVDQLPGWLPAGDAVPAVFDDRIPAYTVPIRST